MSAKFPSQCPDTNCGFIHYDNPVLEVAAIVEAPAGVVVTHNVMWPGDVLRTPTGFLKHREDPALAVIREVQEGRHNECARPDGAESSA